MESKPWYQSKTIWVNILAGAAMVLSASDVLTAIPPKALPVLAAVTAAVNIVLRFITSSAIGVRP